MTTATLPRRRSAYGLDSPVDDRRDWKHRAVCLGAWDVFDGWLPKQYDLQARAIHICRHHCPVLADCWDYTADYPQTSGVVQAGKVWRDGRANDLPDPGCGDHCAHLRRQR